jgi:hypothetical protein
VLGSSLLTCPGEGSPSRFITRRRTHLVMDVPIKDLWAAIGSAGRTPREPSRIFVLVATLLVVLGWVIAPLVATILFRLA